MCSDWVAYACTSARPIASESMKGGTRWPFGSSQGTCVCGAPWPIVAISPCRGFISCTDSSKDASRRIWPGRINFEPRAPLTLAAGARLGNQEIQSIGF